MKSRNHSPESVVRLVADLVSRFAHQDCDLDIDKDVCQELGVDSVSSLDLLLTLETQFGIVIDDLDFMKARTIRQMTSMVQSLSTT